MFGGGGGGAISCRILLKSYHKFIDKVVKPFIMLTTGAMFNLVGLTWKEAATEATVEARHWNDQMLSQWSRFEWRQAKVKFIGSNDQLIWMGQSRLSRWWIKW